MSESGLIDRVILFTHQDRPAKALPASGPAEDGWLDNSLDERQRLIAALEKAGWVQAKAARLLGMTPRQVAYRIQIMDITMPRLWPRCQVQDIVASAAERDNVAAGCGIKLYFSAR
jgi:Nif-specific regulatory protein